MVTYLKQNNKPINSCPEIEHKSPTVRGTREQLKTMHIVMTMIQTPTKTDYQKSFIIKINNLLQFQARHSIIRKKKKNAACRSEIFNFNSSKSS